MATDITECEHCGAQWSLPDTNRDTIECVSCYRETSVNIVGEERLLRGKMLYMQCNDLDDMIAATEQRLALLRDLRDDGYEVADPQALKDDYPKLRKVEGKNKRASLQDRS